MAGKCEKWVAMGVPCGDWDIFPFKGADYTLAHGLTEKRACQIVREHNAHEDLLTACEAALAELEPVLNDALCDEIGERPRLKIEKQLLDAIAKARGK